MIELSLLLTGQWASLLCHEWPEGGCCAPSLVGDLPASISPALACWTDPSARKEAQLLWTQGSSTNLCKWQIWSIIVSVPRWWNVSRCCSCRQGRRSHSFILNLYLCNAMEGGKGEEASCLLSLLLVFTHGYDKLSFSSLCEKWHLFPFPSPLQPCQCICCMQIQICVHFPSRCHSDSVQNLLGGHDDNWTVFREGEMNAWVFSASLTIVELYISDPQFRALIFHFSQAIWAKCTDKPTWIQDDVWTVPYLNCLRTDFICNAIVKWQLFDI